MTTLNVHYHEEARSESNGATATNGNSAECLAGNSLIQCSRGLVRIRTLGNPNGQKRQALDATFSTGHQKARGATEFLAGGSQRLLRIKTTRGYSLAGTPDLAVRIIDDEGQWAWRELRQIRIGDHVPLQLRGGFGQVHHVQLPPLADPYWTSDYAAYVPRYMTPELAEFIGYFMGDGSLHTRSIRLCVAHTDPDVVTHLTALGKSLFGLEARATERIGYTELSFNSVRLVMWWEGCGFTKFAPTSAHRGKGFTPHIPDALLHTNDPTIYAAFIRGLFEADGTQTNQFVSFSTVSESFCNEVQALLLALGFVTTKKVERASAGRWGAKSMNRLRLLNVSSTESFLQKIGFCSMRKQIAQAENHPQTARFDHIPVPRGLIDELAPSNDGLRKTLLMALARNGTVSRRAAQNLLDRSPNAKLEFLLSFFYDQVTAIEEVEEQSAFGVETTPTMPYLVNGFLCLNAP